MTLDMCHYAFVKAHSMPSGQRRGKLSALANEIVFMSGHDRETVDGN